MIASLAFYMFAAILLVSAFMVVTARNPVHSVLFLILAFFNAAGLFVLIGAEFIAMILVIVYVGAVAVMFLFVVMMLDINFTELRKGAAQYVPLGLIVGGLLLAEMATIFAAWQFAPSVQLASVASELVTQDAAIVAAAAQDSLEPITSNILAAGAQDVPVSNTKALGSVIYTDYVFPFQVSGLVLLVSMIGAIVLTLRQRPNVRRQKVAVQNSRTVEESLELRKVTPHSGV
jgi:NADH-quinone oxidoreductase subunit J